MKKDDLPLEDQIVSELLLDIFHEETNSICCSGFLDFNEAAAFIQKSGIPMSKSRLYKLTCQYGIPHRKAGTRLLFIKSELVGWMKSQIHNPVNEYIDTNYEVIKSAQNKI